MLVTPTLFEGLGRHGDFAWMRMQPEHASTLFIFNDNEDQFNTYLNGKGYKSLDTQTKLKIDQSLQVIGDLLASGNYSQLVFSADSTLTTLGKAIFAVSTEVCEYIFKSLINFRSVQQITNHEESAQNE